MEKTDVKEIKLRDGRKAKIREGLGRDLMEASKKAKRPGDIPFALIAELTTIDDKPIVYEDLETMHLKDVMTLQVEAMGNLF